MDWQHGSMKDYMVEYEAGRGVSPRAVRFLLRRIERLEDMLKGVVLSCLDIKNDVVIRKSTLSKEDRDFYNAHKNEDEDK